METHRNKARRLGFWQEYTASDVYGYMEQNAIAIHDDLPQALPTDLDVIKYVSEHYYQQAGPTGQSVIHVIEAAGRSAPVTFDPRITQGKIAFGLTEQPTNYEGLTISFAEWHEGVPVNNKTLGDHVGKSLSAVSKAISSLPKDGEEVLVLAPKALCDAIPEGWLNDIIEERGATVHLKNWGAGIGSNAYKDCYHMIVFGLYHPNKNALKQNVMAHKRHKSQEIKTGTYEDKAMQIARGNWHKRWVVQMLNRIRIRKMVSGEHDLEMYRAQDANIIWIATDKDQDLATDILTTSFRGCTIKQMDDLDLFEDLDEPQVVARKKTTEGKAGFILSKLDREGVTGITLAQVEKRFGWKPKNKKGRDKTATRAKEMGWYYQQGNRRTPAQLLKLQ